MKTHRLKIWPEFFKLIKEGKKDWELRKNDRDFQVGDYLELWEYDPDKALNKENPAAGYTGRHIVVKVLHVHKGGQFGLKEGDVIMSIKRV